MLVIKAMLDGVGKIDYQRYIDADLLPNKETIQHELISSFDLVSRKMAQKMRMLGLTDLRRQQVLVNGHIDYELHNDMDETLEHSLKAEKPDIFPTLIATFNQKNGNERYSTIYGRVDMSRQLFSQLCSFNSNAIPKRENILRLAFALRTTPEEAELLLNAKGYMFRETYRTDIILHYCLEHHIYNPQEVDSLLREHGCETLFSEI